MGTPRRERAPADHDGPRRAPAPGDRGAPGRKAINMSGAIGFGLILLAIAVLVATHGQDRLAGVGPSDFASLVTFIALGLVFTGWMINQFRGRWGQGFAALLLWTAIFSGFIGGYAYRSELREFSARV